jgi:L-threonylcarbamoyladenylate synthase
MNNRIIAILNNGGVGVLLTDTLYGILGQALNKKTVERIYKIKSRNEKKPFIILVASIKDLEKFGIKVGVNLEKNLKKFWPGPTSIILSCNRKKFEYLHRGEKSLCFRVPKNILLSKILYKTGPLVAPSANPEGLPPAQNISQAKKYFGKNVDFYLSGLKSKNKPSSIIKISKQGIEVIR